MADRTDLRKHATQQANYGNYWARKTLSVLDELDAARQALWDVYGILGFDQDGDPTPAAVGDLGEMVRRAAREFRQDYDTALDLIPDGSL